MADMASRAVEAVQAGAPGVAALTPTQRDAVQFVAGQQARHGRGVTHLELMRAMGWRSLGTVSRMVRRLRDAGVLAPGTGHGGSRCIRLRAGRFARVGSEALRRLAYPTAMQERS